MIDRAPLSDMTCDILVAGTGSAGLTAALAASAQGARVIIAEKAGVIGGTTALSGAAIWVPANHVAEAAGLADSPAEALAYLRAAAPDGWAETEDALWARMAQSAGAMLRFVEAHTPLTFQLTNQADPLAALPGAKPRGRMVSPLPLPRRLARPFTAQLRPPLFPHTYSFQEAMAVDLYHHPVKAAFRHAWPLLYRLATGRRGKGTALVTGLLRGCLDQGCTLLLNAPLDSLTMAQGRVTGAMLIHNGQPLRIVATKGVILASGGFEWDVARRDRHFPGPTALPASPRSNTGDAHRMAEAAGATLAHMDQANFAPAVPTRYEDQAHGLSIYFHQEPNAILVDGSGQRFVDEQCFNLGEQLDRRAPATGALVHDPVWLISDAVLWKRAPVLRFYARRYGKNWLKQAPTLPALARIIGLPEAPLEATVTRYNGFAASGRDADFGRAATGPVGMAPISRGPFVALPFTRAFMSTKGGPRTDATGRVLRPDGSSIPGLFCAGVAMANPIGTRAVGAGTTIGPNMLWGYVCGLTATDHDWSSDEAAPC
ncbi:FAD-dependent oxidoreductase [Acidisoma silvae]|uniref:FAD-binding protein n=1 Tax=Acidisoma silvae TaxID=2802396 RepID=A0A963YPZ0_9PROT|nr:FAD-dependent oxidoreductase [Acidisoma silvae]MCB8874626.1 FAD-binding protein [Acidisoma silvae]